MADNPLYYPVNFNDLSNPLHCLFCNAEIGNNTDAWIRHAASVLLCDACHTIALNN